MDELKQRFQFLVWLRAFINMRVMLDVLDHHRTMCHSCAAGSIVTNVSVRAPLNGVMRGWLGERAYGACMRSWVLP